MEINEQRQGKTVHIGQLLPERLQEPVQLSDVELTQNEYEEAIYEAKLKKQGRLEEQRKKQLAEQKAADLRRPWTPSEMSAYAFKRGSQMLAIETGNQAAMFEPTKFQVPIIHALSLYFTLNPGFEFLDIKLYNKLEFPFSLGKGIWLWGNPGVGKTMIMNMFSRNRRLCYSVVQCPKLVAGYVKNGDDQIAGFGRVIKESEDALSFYQKEKGICYNDLGVETSPAKHYGTPVNVMESIFMDTYENKVPFWHRHVTTNLTFEQVKQTYGIRFVDRIKQCFNILEVDGKSLRK